METKWKLQTDGKGFFWVDEITKDGGFSICNLGESDEDVVFHGMLIAAAPELVTTLMRMTVGLMKQDIGDCIWYEDIEWDAVDEFRDLCKRLNIPGILPLDKTVRL